MDGDVAVPLRQLLQVPGVDDGVLCAGDQHYGCANIGEPLPRIALDDHVPDGARVRLPAVTDRVLRDRPRKFWAKHMREPRRQLWRSCAHALVERMRDRVVEGEQPRHQAQVVKSRGRVGKDRRTERDDSGNGVRCQRSDAQRHDRSQGVADKRGRPRRAEF